MDIFFQVTYDSKLQSKHLKGQLWPRVCDEICNVFAYSCPAPLPGQFWPRVSDEKCLWRFSVTEGQLWPRVSDKGQLWPRVSDVKCLWRFSVEDGGFSPECPRPKLYPGPTIQSRSAARRAA